MLNARDVGIRRQLLTMTSLQAFYDTIPDLRNGDPSTYNVLHVAAGIPARFYYLDPAAAVPDPTTDVVTYIRLVAAFYAYRITAADPSANVEMARAYGLVLSCTRAGMNKAWRVAAGDLEAAQVVTPSVPIWDGSAVGDARVTVPAIREHYAAMTGDLVEESLLGGLMRLGFGTYITCGVILVRTEGQHHFVAPHKPISTVLFRQVFGKDTPPPYGLMMDDFEDIAFHKAPHPISSGAMMSAARSTDNVVRMRQARLAAAAVRLPAQYPPEASASAIAALARKAASTGRVANVAVAVDDIVEECNAVSQGDMRTPAQRSAAVDAMAALYERHKEDIAFCAGLLVAACAAASVARPKLLKAKAIERAMQDEFDALTSGQRQMDAALRVEREKSRRGIIAGVGMFGAEAPPPTEPLPADEQLAQILSAVMGNQRVPSAPAP